MIVMIFCAGILLALCFPETRIGQAARRIFVDKPADWLNALTLRRVIWGVVLGLIVMAALSVFPAEFALIAAGDITAYVEILTAITLVVARVPVRRAASGLKSQVQDLGRTLRNGVQRSRTRRRLTKPLSRKESDDSEADWVLA